jgi:DNA transformation protein
MDIKNIGPKTAQWLREVDVHSRADLERLGSVEVYVRLKQSRPAQVSLNALWGLEAAIRNVSWQKLPKSVKDRLRAEVKNILGE